MDIAQLSRKDNLAMREVAIAAAKDSATMRVIAAVTLFFLPPTFVAVSFWLLSFRRTITINLISRPFLAPLSWTLSPRVLVITYLIGYGCTLS